MDGSQVLREQLTWTRGLTEQAIDGLTPDELQRQLEGATIKSIAHIYAHMTLAEDWLISRFINRQESVFVRDGWDKKTGILPYTDHGPSEDWPASVRNGNIEALREFAQVSYANTDAFLASLTPADLSERTVTFGRLGEMPLGKFLANIVAGHTAHHCGEICALKGVLGKQGLPF